MLLTDGRRATRHHAPAGQNTLTEDWTGLWARTWDARGMPATDDGPNSPLGWPLSFGHDSAGQRVVPESRHGRLSWQRDPRGLAPAAGDSAGSAEQTA
jgi:hypothetical protein